MKKKFLTLFLAAMLTLSLAACGDKDSNNTSGGSGSQVEAGAEVSNGKVDSVQNDAKDNVQPEAAPVDDPMKAALKNVNSASSMEAQVVMEMDMVVSVAGYEESMESVTTMDMVCFYDTLKFKVDMSMDMGEAGSQKATIYADTVEDGSIMTYMYDGQQWQSEVAGAIDLEEYDARRSMSTYIGDTSAYTNEGMEEVNGANAYKYSYVMTGDEMKEALLSSGSLGSLAELGINESQLDGMLDDLGELVTYVWVDEATLYPVKYEMDMTEVMDKLLSNMFEAMGEEYAGISMSIPKMTMIMTCSNFNNATDFTIPDEAKHVN